MPKLVKKDKPIRARVVIGLGVWRIPEGPITPRLKPKPTPEPVSTDAIGFRAQIVSVENEGK